MCHHRICPEVLVHIRASLPLGCGRPRKPSAMTRQTVVAGVWLRGSFRRLHRQSTTGAESVWATDGQVLLFWRHAALCLYHLSLLLWRGHSETVYSRPRCRSVNALRTMTQLKRKARRLDWEMRADSVPSTDDSDYSHSAGSPSEQRIYSAAMLDNVKVKAVKVTESQLGKDGSK